MSEYSVSCARMKILEQNTDSAGLSYYQMMENAGTIAANRIVEITITSPINDACFRGESAPTYGADGASPGQVASAASPACVADAPEPAAPGRYAYMMERPIRARVYCGKGNNGGDGFVVARLLHQRGWQVELILVDGEPTTPDAIANYQIAQKLEIPVRDLLEVGAVPQTGDVENQACPENRGAGSEMQTGAPASSNSDASFREPDVIVDAIYGTGFHGKLRERGALAAEQIAYARGNGARVFALDIPSGMGGDLTEETELDPRCVRADVTITFHAKKTVHLQDFAGEYCGRIIVADIGIVDPELVDHAAGQKRFDLAADEKYSFDDFVEIISRLRAPDGCPWDREQTHRTLKKYLLEETQEAAEAIDNADDENLCEELGDVLLQIVLHAQIAKEREVFSIDDVIQGVSEKMIRRHPWVFGDMEVSTPEEGERLWEEIKRKEKK